MARRATIIAVAFAALRAASADKPPRASAPKATEMTPLITTDLLYGTYDLLSGACSTALAKSNLQTIVADAAKQLPMDDARKFVAQQMKAVPPEVMQKLDEVPTQMVQLKALATDLVGQAYEPANAAAVSAITAFEKAMPKYKGLIPKTLGNLVLNAAFMLVVLYVVLKVALFALRILKAIVCCFCCCGCCCLRGGKKTDAKTKPSAKTKAAVGKAAAKPAAKKGGK